MQLLECDSERQCLLLSAASASAASAAADGQHPTITISAPLRAGGEVTRPLCLALLSAFEAGGQSKAATQVRQAQKGASAGQQH